MAEEKINCAVCNLDCSGIDFGGNLLVTVGAFQVSRPVCRRHMVEIKEVADKAIKTYIDAPRS